MYFLRMFFSGSPGCPSGRSPLPRGESLNRQKSGNQAGFPGDFNRDFTGRLALLAESMATSRIKPTGPGPAQSFGAEPPTIQAPCLMLRGSVTRPLPAVKGREKTFSGLKAFAAVQTSSPEKLFSLAASVRTGLTLDRWPLGVFCDSRNIRFRGPECCGGSAQKER